MRFAHIADSHLGGWRIPELQELNMASFRKAIDYCVKSRVDFVLFAGDLFDSPYPPIEILKQAFSEFRRLKDEKIPVFIIAGSHDYSASGKTFLDVLEKAGLCVNVYSPETRDGDDTIYLNPTIIGDVAIYGFPGKKTGLEVQELRRVKLNDAPGFFKVFMLHTAIKDAVKTLPIDSVDESLLPRADYYALGHLHIDYANGKFVYSGPTFPNNFQELEELKGGSFFIVNTNPFSYDKKLIRLKGVVYLNLELDNALNATDFILSELSKRELNDMIVLLRLHGSLVKGRVSNIDFVSIEKFVKERGAHSFLKTNTKLVRPEFSEVDLEITHHSLVDIEEEIITKYSLDNPSPLNTFLRPLMNSLSIDKKEDEKALVFSERLFSDVKKVLGISSDDSEGGGG